MADVKVGMRLKSERPGELSPITVTEITAEGFKYRLDREIPYLPREGLSFAIEGHEHFGSNGESFYELEKPEPKVKKIISHYEDGKLVRIEVIG